MRDHYEKLLKQAHHSLSRITIYRNIMQDEAVRVFSQLINELSSANPIYENLIEKYHLLSSQLISLYGMNNRIVGDLWQHHIVNLIINDENIFSLTCERGNIQNIPEPILTVVQYDLKYMQLLFNINGRILQEALKDKTSIEVWPSWEISTDTKLQLSIGTILLNSESWENTLEELAHYYSENGCGIFNKFKAFRWIKKGHFGSLMGISSPDPVRFANLIGYERERSSVIENTLQFIHGFPANNVLLYGDRGTGKSSTVKALLNEYSSKGLRLIEVSKYHLNDLPEILEILQNRGLKFIIFVDDLSFESDESQYRELKSILEGGIEIRPQNVLIYATSNRRHLIKEYFSERSTSDEISSQDTLQEKLSLADRFGITVTFISPDQERYLKIVEELARQRNLEIDKDVLRNSALKWEIKHNGRTPRTARQFIDHLEGQLKLQDVKNALR
ncbi:MAG: AAA+-like ATPase [Clostridia bacterium]|uniref:ATP-binding protein n=1 Tax=Petroclostridium xylanilyticum TaxID=1792311 RepID=UPI000B97D7A8|nr:ATP-binding protein [Petroclostridium xylanilyticum]MBZ4646127.1 AAA+-like ATPase [Clostridia bacterium]